MFVPAPPVSVHLLAPAHRAVVGRGVRPTFVVKDRRGRIGTVEVSDSPRTDATGVFATSLWSTGYVSGATRTTVRPERASADRFWKRPGIYYWHVYRVVCPSTGPRPHTCHQRALTPTHTFRII